MSSSGIQFDSTAKTKPGVVATIGVFDGVHRGHQGLISSVRKRAGVLGVDSMVITFDPHPVVVLAAHLPPQRLGSRPVEERWLEATGVDHAWFIPFSRPMSEWPPEQFLDYLTEHLDLHELWIGYDFRFGKGRAGDAAFLEARSLSAGFTLHVFDAVASERGSGQGQPGVGRIFSSTWVRELLGEGNIRSANRILGHPFEIQGEVIRGRGIGTSDLVPTANLDLRAEQVLPKFGIYVGWAALGSDSEPEWLPAVANVGIRPTVEESGRPLVEVHVLDWNKSVYGQEMRFRFGDWVRAEEKYEGIAELRAAIDRDLDWARSWFSSRTD